MINEIQITKLLRSRRRTIGLEITNNAELIVRAPKRASFSEINKVIQEKHAWILRHQKAAQEKIKQHVPKKFIDGEEFLYLGENFPLQITENLNVPLQFDQTFFLNAKYHSVANKVFTDWYCQQAHYKFSERSAFYAQSANLSYQKIRISNAKTLWGSCGTDGSLSFSWRLIMAPLHVIDYVVAHELAHLKYRGHSKRFWQKVAALYPEYEIGKKWLKQHGYLLNF